MSPRRLPIYLLLDCSESMAGIGIQSVEAATREFHTELMHDPFSLEAAFISVITFNSENIEVFPLKELPEFKPPKLKVSGTAAFGAVLTLLKERIEAEVRKSTPEQRGDYKPFVFLLTDGAATDDWEAAADTIKQTVSCNIICLACGEDPDLEQLKRVSDTVLIMKDMTPDCIHEILRPF